MSKRKIVYNENELDLLFPAENEFFLSTKNNLTGDNLTPDRISFFKIKKTREYGAFVSLEGKSGKYRMVSKRLLLSLFKNEKVFSFVHPETGKTMVPSKKRIKSAFNRYYAEIESSKGSGSEQVLKCFYPDSIAKEMCGLTVAEIVEMEGKVDVPTSLEEFYQEKLQENQKKTKDERTNLSKKKNLFGVSAKDQIECREKTVLINLFKAIKRDSFDDGKSLDKQDSNVNISAVFPTLDLKPLETKKITKVTDTKGHNIGLFMSPKNNDEAEFLLKLRKKLIGGKKMVRMLGEKKISIAKTRCCSGLTNSQSLGVAIAALKKTMAKLSESSSGVEGTETTSIPCTPQKNIGHSFTTPKAPKQQKIRPRVFDIPKTPQEKFSNDDSRTGSKRKLNYDDESQSDYSKKNSRLKEQSASSGIISLVKIIHEICLRNQKQESLVKKENDVFGASQFLDNMIDRNPINSIHDLAEFVRMDRLGFHLISGVLMPYHKAVMEMVYNLQKGEMLSEIEKYASQNNDMTSFSKKLLEM